MGARNPAMSSSSSGLALLLRSVVLLATAAAALGTNITGANTSIAGKSSGSNSIVPDHRARSFTNVTNYETRLAAATSWNATSQHPELSGDTSGVKATTSTTSAPRHERLVGLEPTDSPETGIVDTTNVIPSTTAKSTPTSLLLGKNVIVSSSKTKNELVGGEIKSSQKTNHRNHAGYVGGGGKIVKPNVNLALGKYTPYFEDGLEEVNVTARIGNTVVLDCEIGMLGNKTVTWSYHNADVIRLLTVGRSAYIDDQRICLYFKYPTNWRLKIESATPRDSGLYECQVATYPPLVKKIHLLVTAPLLVIMDDSGRIKSGERHLKAGSALRLRCEARDVIERHNETVIWTRGDDVLSDDISENKTVEFVDGREIQVVVSTIVVERATPRHAGNYSCVVPEKAKTTVAVHVLNGELPAAVHDGNGVSRSVLNLWLIHLTVSYVFSR